MGMLGWSSLLLLLLLFSVLPAVSPLTCYTGINAEYKEWVKEIHRLVNGSAHIKHKDFLNAVDRHVGLKLAMRKEKCAGTDLCLMAKKLRLPQRSESTGGYVSRCEKRKHCDYFRSLLRRNVVVEEVICCDQELCNLPYPPHIETEQPLPPIEIIKSSRNHRKTISSKLRTVVSFGLPVAVVLLLG